MKKKNPKIIAFIKKSFVIVYKYVKLNANLDVAVLIWRLFIDNYLNKKNKNVKKSTQHKREVK